MAKSKNEQNRTSAGKKAMLGALEKHLGIIALATKDVGVVRSTHYKWMEEDEEYRNSVNDISEAVIDFVEGHLHKRIKEGDTTSMIFYLKTKGKKRGYVERQEMDLRTPEGVTINYNLQKGNEPLSDEG